MSHRLKAPFLMSTILARLRGLSIRSRIAASAVETAATAAKPTCVGWNSLR